MPAPRFPWVAALFCVCLTLLMPSGASAAPFAEIGDSQLRADIEILAAAGVIDDVTTQWPFPWGGVLYRLDRPGALSGQPRYVVEAANRVRTKGAAATQKNQLQASVDFDATNSPATVRGFDALGRQAVQGQFVLDETLPMTAFHLAVGARTTNRVDHQELVFDGSYVAQRVGNAAVYAGYLPHWWGPGWSTALSLSDNARPFPQIGITRVDTTPFKSPLLSWMGPWQAEFFAGVLDGKRIASNTLFNGLRISINPLPGLEFALARTEQLCGTGHPCEPVSEFFNLYNSPTRPSKSKDETNIDIRYTGIALRLPYAVYMQLMNRDTGPFVHSDTSHLFGSSIWIPAGDTAIRLTAEYASTISTQNLFSFGQYLYGTTYTDYKYTDGWQYRGVTMGSSLGGDSRLAMLQAGFTGSRDIAYTLTYDRAQIGSLQAPTSNIVTTSPVTLDSVEARISFPLNRSRIDLAARLQDNQPRPDHGYLAAIEAALHIAL